MSTQQSHVPGFLGDSPRPVWVRVGALDQQSVRQARQVLSSPFVWSASSVTVDLTGLDDGHELTGLALLVELKRHVARNGGTITVVNAPCRLAANLLACELPVAPDAVTCPRGAFIVEVGAPVPEQRGPRGAQGQAT